MYLILILYDHKEHAVKFLEKFGPEQEDYYQDDLKRLAMVENKEQIKGNELAEIYKYVECKNIRISYNSNNGLL